MTDLSNVAALIHLVVALFASGHVVLNHPQSRGAALWVGIVWLVPWLGPALYALLGINHMPRRARSRIGLQPESWGEYRNGNRILPLVGGDEAYAKMIEAIDAASDSVVLVTYIFDNDRAGAMFRDALARAVGRGVEVRVLIDALGAHYSSSPISRSLSRLGITVKEFLPTAVPWRWQYANLRCHRKIMVADNTVAFLGGMNIRELCMASLHPRDVTLDVHFKVEGPVVEDIAALFESDWSFACGLMEKVERVSAAPIPGGVRARLVSGGPDDLDEPSRWLKLAALVRANRRVRIVTPYFVPDDDVVTALFAAASAGVKIQLVLPATNNLRLVAWASRASFSRLISQGVEIILSPPPFEHTKLMLVDEGLVIVGSSNWDERSFRLNFEVDLECQDPELSAALHAMVDARLEGIAPLTLQAVQGASLISRLRNGIARLATPYL